MYGYLTASEENMGPREKERYRACYCGLCRAIGRRCGEAARLTLSYDMVLLVLLLTSLYEPEEKTGSGICVPHPLKARPFCDSEAFAYAADVSVILAYHKAADDRLDDRSLKAAAFGQMLRGSYQRIRAERPTLCRTAEQVMAEIRELETQPDSGSAVCDAFGRLMGEIFAWREDIWADALRRFGRALGRFVVLMDAVMDYQADRKRKRYNALAAMGIREEKPEKTEAVLLLLNAMMGEATEVFERLPLDRDLPLMRNILYSGVWQQYNARFMRKEIETSRAGKET